MRGPSRPAAVSPGNGPSPAAFSRRAWPPHQPPGRPHLRYAPHAQPLGTIPASTTVFFHIEGVLSMAVNVPVLLCGFFHEMPFCNIFSTIPKRRIFYFSSLVWLGGLTDAKIYKPPETEENAVCIFSSQCPLLGCKNTAVFSDNPASCRGIEVSAQIFSMGELFFNCQLTSSSAIFLICAPGSLFSGCHAPRKQ